MADNAATIITELISLLKADSTFMNLTGGRLYTYVPQTPTYPFVYMLITSQPFEEWEVTSMTHTVRFQAFSNNQPSPQEALNIRSSIVNVLQRNDNFEQCDVSLAELFLEPDRKTYQALLEFVVK